MEMINYPILFPCSSSASTSPSPGTPAAGDPSAILSLNTVGSYGTSHAFSDGDDQFRHGSGEKTNGFSLLGLSSGADQVEAPAAEARAGSEEEMRSSGCNKMKKAGDQSGKKIRQPRYAFQTRSQVDILDDGYRWRKYGQKAVKNNKFARSYYRCTHQGCNVKKQVQRLSKDEGVVVTTYEGMHSHPIEQSTDNFEHILSQMQIYPSF
ncbi:probable WRKY transcription factor 75 [Malania oleifera]|uniref:probable WRKY transcription factor 75 n=1 Tax=Malania oleifera TaxID=397392 RepID=UPI0025ADC04E|nr:probable WRKY transcription factor 75 [Malania oleifera]